MPSRPSLVLTYHEICDPAQHSYTVSTKQFEEHVRIARDLSEPPVFTFDDGHESAVTAAEVLSKYGITGTFFITAGWLGTKSGYLTERDVQEIASASHKIGAHGWSHVFLTHCTDEVLARELQLACQILSKISGAPVKTMSAPGGRFNSRVLAAAAQAGYESFYTSEPTVQVRKADQLTVIGRLNIDNTISHETYERLLQPNSRELKSRLRSYRVRSSLRACIGDTMYHRLWSLATGYKGQQG